MSLDSARTTRTLVARAASALIGLVAMWVLGPALHGVVPALAQDTASAAEALRAAVLPFRTPAGDAELAPMGSALADMLATDLSVAPDLRLVERMRLRDLKEEIALGQSGAVDRATAVRAGKLLGADMLVLGSVHAFRPTMRIDVRIVAAASGEVVASAAAEGAVDAFFDVETELAKKLLTALGSALTPMARMRIGRGQTTQLPAALAYGRGLQAEDRGDADGARKAFGEALAVDPGFAAATRRLKALEQRVEALEARTEAVEIAGGRIMRPTTILDHWHNAVLARARGDEAQALRDVQEVLQRAPAALDAIALFVTLGGDPARLPEPSRGLASASRAVERGHGDAALAATAAWQGDSLPKGSAAAPALASRWLRMRALQLRLDAERSAEERQELAALALSLHEPGSDDGIFVQGEARELATRSLAAARSWAEQPIGLGRPRRELLERPVMVAFPERSDGQGQPWLRLDVRVAEARTSSVVVHVRAGRERRTWTPILQQPSAWGPEATYWTVHCPDPPLAERSWELEIERTDVRGRAQTTTLVLPPPKIWGGNWRALGSGVGRWSEGAWPMLGVRVEPLLPRPGAAWWVLVDAAAGIWGDVREPEEHGWVWQPLWAGVAGPAANGVAYWDHRVADGSRAIGLRLPWVVLRLPGQAKASPAPWSGAAAPSPDTLGAAEPLALGSLTIERRWAADGRTSYRSAARAGLLDGPLDGFAADLDVEITVASLMTAGHTALAHQAMAGAKLGLSPLGLLLWRREPRHRRAELALEGASSTAKSSTASSSTVHRDVAPEASAPADADDALAVLRSRGRSETGTRIALRGGLWLDRDPVTADAYGHCVAQGACAAVSDDRCHDRGPDLHGDQPASCLSVAPNPYPISRVCKLDAQRYCAFVGGSLPTRAQWQEAAAQAGATGNGRDAVTCAWRGADPGDIPASCHPQRSQREVGWDGHAWMSPSGQPGPGLPGNVRSWLGDGDDLVAGCSYQDDTTTEPGCAERVVALGAWTDQAVGIRCVTRTEEVRPLPTSRRKASKSHSSLRWRQVPAGEAVIGMSGERPAFLLTPVDSAALAAVARDVPGLDASTLQTFVGGLAKLQLQGAFTAAMIEELLARGRWQGLAPDATLGRVVTTLTALDDTGLRPIGLGLPIDSLRRAAQRKGNEAGLAQMVLDECLRELRRDVAETPKPDNAVVWHDDQPLFCDERPVGRCEDATGSASNRLTMQPRTIWKVSVSAFDMLETEVTQEAFAAVLSSEPSLWPCPSCPVERVTWQQADAFCRAVGGQLPTEAQWSRAVRGDDAGHRPGRLDDVAWTRINSKLRPHAVGGKAAGPFGHRDLLGSVWEWLRDGWEDSSSYGYAQRPTRLSTGKELDPTLPPTGVCLTNGRSLREIEANAASLPWIETKRHGPVLCFASEEEARAKVDALLRDNPQGPPPSERRRRHVLVGGSYGSDERLVHAGSRVGFGWQLRSPFVGFRCVRAAR